MLKYSVVIPVYNEAENIAPLYQRLKKTMDGLKNNYEIIFVNDGSSDKSSQALNALGDQAQIIELKSNQGQAQALQAGFDRAQGEVIVTMDADLQDNPEDIALLVERLNQGYELVCGWRRKRQDKILKKLVSRLGNALQRLILRVPIHDNACPLKVMRRECLKEFNLSKEITHLFIPFILKRKGYKISEVAVKHSSRLKGYSKYSLLSQCLRVVKGFFHLRYFRS